MTNRDPNTTDFYRKVNEFQDCLENYWKISNEDKLEQDAKRSDIDLVCFHEHQQLREHARNTNGMNYNDFVKMHPVEERKFMDKLNNVI